MRRHFVLIGVVALGGYFLVDSVGERRGLARTEALLRGDEKVRLHAFEVVYQQRRVRCTDPESLRYIERCFRENSRADFDDRITYRVSLQFAGGGRLDMRTDWSKGGFSLCMPGDRLLQDGGEPRAWIVFRAPVPSRVQEMINFLNDYYRRARGKVLHLEAGTSWFETDDSLLAD